MFFNTAGFLFFNHNKSVRVICFLFLHRFVDLKSFEVSNFWLNSVSELGLVYHTYFE